MITVIRNAWIVTQNANRDIVKGDIAIENEIIIQVGGTYNSTGDREIDASGDIVMPGMINTHSHVAMSILKGVVDDLTFPDFLNKVFKIDSDRQAEDIALGTKIGCMEMMRSGTTTFIDLYYDEDVIARSVQESGIRGVCCWCTLDEQYTTQKGNPVKNAEKFCKEFRNERKIVPGVGIQGVYVAGEETCVAAAELSRELDVPLTLHLSETQGEVKDHKNKYGKRPGEWLAGLGVFGPNVIAAHSAWMTETEVRLMGESGMSIASCPVSNMKLATGGVAPIPEYEKYGVNVTFGTDGNTTNNSLDMFGEMKILGLLQKSSRWDPTVTPAQKLLDYATVNGAKAIGMSDKLGSIEPGKYADLTILDGRSPNLRPALPENMVANIVYAANPHNVKTVLCQGDIVLRDREVVNIDEGAILDKSEEMWKKFCLR